MANSFFQFKQFRIEQGYAAMKVGVDSVILGSWLPLKTPDSVLDIGTGTGLLALMMAQRSIDSQIVAVEIDDDAILDARHNFQTSVFASRLDLVHASIQEFAMLTDRRFKLVVSNPPYFDAGNRAASDGRSTARHHDALSLNELLTCASELLTPDGDFALILPYDMKEKVQKIAHSKHLFLNSSLSIHPTPEKDPNRIALLFGKTKQDGRHEVLTVRKNGEYTREYKDLTRDFYL